MTKTRYLLCDLMNEFEAKGLIKNYSVNVFLSIPKEERDRSSVKDLALRLRPMLEKRLEEYHQKIRQTADTMIHWRREEIEKRQKESLENKENNPEISSYNGSCPSGRNIKPNNNQNN